MSWWRRGRQGDDLGESSAIPPTADAPATAAPAQGLSNESVDRLRQRVHAETDEFRTAATIDLTLLSTLAELGEFEDAAEALARQRVALRRMQAGLEAALAEAAVEREAQRIVGASIAELPAVGPALALDASLAGDSSAPAGEHDDAEPQPVLAGVAPASGRGAARRSMAGIVAAAAVAVALVMPALRNQEPPPDVTAADQEAVELQLAAARAQLAAVEAGAAVADGAVAREASELHAVIRSLPDEVLDSAEGRAQVTAILQRECDTLHALVGQLASADALLDDLRILNADLGLGLDVPVVGQPPAVPLPVTPAPPAPTVPVPVVVPEVVESLPIEPTVPVEEPLPVEQPVPTEQPVPSEEPSADDQAEEPAASEPPPAEEPTAPAEEPSAPEEPSPAAEPSAESSDEPGSTRDVPTDPGAGDLAPEVPDELQI